MEKNKPRIVKSGEMMQGICMQWLLDEHGSDKKIMRAAQVYGKTLRKTFGYRNRWGYIPQDYFAMCPKQLKRYRDVLTEAGLLEWKTTKQMTLYKILEPRDIIKTFVFTKKNTEEDTEIIDENDKYSAI